MTRIALFAFIIAAFTLTGLAKADKITKPRDSIADSVLDHGGIPLIKRNDALAFKFMCVDNTTYTNTGWMDERISNAATFEGADASLYSGTVYSWVKPQSKLRCDKVCVYLVPQDKNFWSDPTVTSISMVRERASLADTHSTTLSWNTIWNLGNPNQAWVSNNFAMPDGDVTEHGGFCWDAKWTDNNYAVYYNYTSSDASNYAYRLRVTFTDAGGVVHTFFANPYFPGVTEFPE